jgi:uncharacterized membrane protein YedE/YeeE
MAIIINIAAGLVFGVGLIISGMADPAKVLNFLDVTGAWDPSLAFVMGGAIAVALPGYWLVFCRSRPILATHFSLPREHPLDRRLIVGSAMFGIGWGLAGFCPGPAVVSLALGAPGTLVFVPAMLIGIAAAAALIAALRGTTQAQALSEKA